MAISAAMVLVVFVVGTRVLFSRVIPPAPAGVTALEGFTMRDGQPAATVVTPDSSATTPLPPEQRLQRVLEQGTLRVGFFADAVPYSFYNPEHELVGYDVEMANGLATAMGVRLEFVPIGRDELAPALDSGRCDIVMSGVAVTTRAAESVAFSAPYHEERFQLSSWPITAAPNSRAPRCS